MKRSPLQSRTALKRGKPLRQRSRKQAKRYREYAKTFPELEGVMCAIRSPVCTGRAQGWHHLKKKSQGGSDRPGNKKPSCNPCNGWIEDNAAKARKRGLVVYSWEPEPTEGA